MSEVSGLEKNFYLFGCIVYSSGMKDYGVFHYRADLTRGINGILLTRSVHHRYFNTFCSPNGFSAPHLIEEKLEICKTIDPINLLKTEEEQAVATINNKYGTLDVYESGLMQGKDSDNEATFYIFPLTLFDT